MIKGVRIGIVFMSLLSNFLTAQIPNNEFENWQFNGGYSDLIDWATLNKKTSPFSQYSAVRLSPGNPGNYYLCVKTLSIIGKGIIPGRVVSGKIDTNTYKPISGYPFNNRPEVLNYNIQYMAYDQFDSSSVSVLLTKWNSILGKRDSIAFGANYYNAMAHSWFVGSLYLNYLSGSDPDSAMIIISSSSSNPKEGSYIYLDNFKFNGSVIGIEEPKIDEKDVGIYPNPASNSISVKIKDNAETTFIYVYNSIGNRIYSLMASEYVNINTSSWEKGYYIFRIVRNNKYSINRKIIIE